MILHGFGKRTKDNACFGQCFLKGGGNRDAVKDRIDSHTGEHFLLFEGNAEFFIGGEQFGIDFVQTFGAIARLLGRCVIDDALIIDIGIGNHGPLFAFFAFERVCHGQPMAIGF